VERAPVKLTRRHVLIGAGAVAACGIAFLAGRFSRSAETKTVTKTEVQTVTLYAAHATTTSTDKTRVRVVTTTKREPGGTVYVTRTEDRANDLRLNLDWTATESNRASETAEAMTVSSSTRPGWSVGASALWSARDLSPKPDAYQLEVDRRLFGTLWVGVRATTDKHIGAAARLEW
jgi:hypothetical protein